MNFRIIPCLLLKHQGLVKTVKFSKETYIGDPINAIRIFNEKEVDELVFLDILATKENRGPDLEYIKHLAGECFMPFAYGGGISSLEQIGELNAIGVEKVIINSAAFNSSDLINNAVERFGSSTIVISIDIKKDFFGNYHVYINGGAKKIALSLKEVLHKINEWQVGEVIVNSIDRDGMMKGYDEALIKYVTDILDMPVIALGGAGTINDFKSVVNYAGASAVAAGSFFVFYGPYKAVLINYPTLQQIKEINK